MMAEQPKSQTEFDPNRSPLTSPAARHTYLTLPDKEVLKINSDTLQVVPMKGKLYPAVPLKLPKELMAVDQPWVRTCGRSVIDQVSKDYINKGCESSVGGGCPILTHFGRVGPCNVIIEKDGKVDSVPCHLYYSGVRDGRPTIGTAYQRDGWAVLTDRTQVPENIYDPVTRRETVRLREVADLAPFYDHLKKEPEPPRKRGRPKKEPAPVAD